MNLEPGAVFEGFRILERLKAGWLATTYQARGADGRTRRLQCVASPRGADAMFEERFVAAAARLARLQHPHLVRVYDFGQQAVHCWVATEVAPPTSLQDVLTRGGLERSRLGKILGAAASALDYLHEHGLSHGDLTPGDIRVDDGAVCVDMAADWIVARVLGLRGNPHYVPPEFCGDTTGAAGDRYALGMMAYEGLVGVSPFGNGGLAAEFTRKMNDDLASAPGGDVSAPALAVLRQCLAADVGRRWRSASAFVSALTAEMD